MPDYKPVPVDIARQIAHAFQKSIVVIVSHDPVHERIHTTTYGIGQQDKHRAAQLGDVLAAAAGSDLARKEVFSDFRQIDTATNAQRIDWMLRACGVADAALAAVLGVRERLSEHLIGLCEEARHSIAVAIDATTAEGQANRGGAEGDKQA